ncbi:MAG: (Fe-S)-binding protein [Desulfobacula sp.]|nr:(Fe-S)-binding protein [Desulfobacula sp.]
MQQLARDVKKLGGKLAVCTSCGMCHANCPLFAQTHKEADVSRGKLTLIKGLIQEMFEDAKGVEKRLQKCLLCGSCAHGCPSQVNTLEIFLKARAIIAQYHEMPFFQKIIFKNHLAHPEVFNGIMDKLIPFQKLFFKEEKNLQGTSCARIASPVLRNRHIVSLKKSPFNKTLKGEDLIIKGEGVKVAFFTGCLIDKMLPDIAHSVIDVLKYFNAQVFIPFNQGCCGIPSIASGDIETFEKLVKTNVKLFLKQDFDYLVTACATCTSTIVNLWPSMLQDEDSDFLNQVEKLARKTVDISWLMEKRFDLFSIVPENRDSVQNQDPEKTYDTKEIITYHDPCHLKKSLGVFEEPRQVIHASGSELKEMADSDTCCGMGGSFNLKHYDISSKIGLQKAKNIIDTECSIVATSCPACIMQISDMLAKLNHSIHVKHPVQIYANALKSCNTLKGKS